MKGVISNEKQVVYKAKNVTFTYDAERQELYQKWDGYVQSRVFRDAIDALVLIAKKHTIYFLISDTSTMSTLSPTDNAYAAGVMESLFQLGTKFMAFLMPEKTLSKMAVKRFTKTNSTEINIGHFSSLPEARKWVEDNRF